jgi:hypothetical protein
MQEDGDYIHCETSKEEPFNIHEKFFEVTEEIVESAKLFD